MGKIDIDVIRARCELAVKLSQKTDYRIGNTRGITAMANSANDIPVLIKALEAAYSKMESLEQAVRGVCSACVHGRDPHSDRGCYCTVGEVYSRTGYIPKCGFWEFNAEAGDES